MRQTSQNKLSRAPGAYSMLHSECRTSSVARNISRRALSQRNLWHLPPPHQDHVETSAVTAQDAPHRIPPDHRRRMC